MDIYWYRGTDAAARSGENLRRSLIRYMKRKRGKTICDDICVKRSPSGKPFLSERENVEFSVTHTTDWWICAVGDAEFGAVGIDAEKRIRRVRKPISLGRRFFSAEEAELLERLPAEKAERLFLQIWVRKEAFLKYTGAGLAGGMYSFSSVSAGADGEIYLRKKITAEDTTVEFLTADISEDLYVVLCCRAGMKDREREIWKLT